MGYSRRRFLTTSLTTAGTGMAALPLIQGCASAAPATTHAGPGDAAERFAHGVASGDPLADRVILWTRVTPTRGATQHEVRWSLAEDPGLRRPVAGGSLITSARRDWTVKVDATGLDPERTYYYRFECDGVPSPVGRTRTLPVAGTRHLRIAFTSCSNWPFGFFNVYGRIAERLDLDLVLHLGDYIYEYDNHTYGDGRSIGRLHEPDREIVSLADYRTRHAQYRTDPDLQAMTRQHPLVTVWDDHELANNSWRDGAENHDPAAGEGHWPDRKAAAARAWFEWLPVREPPPERNPRIYRSFRVGDLLDLIMLDTRIYGRDREAAAGSDRTVIDDPRRSLLGPAQEAWLLDELTLSRQAGTPWRILGQQVMFGQLGGFPGQPIFNTDQWDGYAPARQRILDHLAGRTGGPSIDNVAVLTGDIHSSWAMDLAPDPFDAGAYDPDTGRGALAVEFVTPSVTSPFITDRAQAEERARSALDAHPHMQFVDLFHKGYVVLDITRERLQAEWYHMDTIERRDDGERFVAAFATANGANHLEPVATPSDARAAADPAP